MLSKDQRTQSPTPTVVVSRFFNKAEDVSDGTVLDAPPPKPKPDGPPPFEPFDVEAAAKASRERRPPPPPPPPKTRTGLANLDPKERRSVALVVEGLEAGEGGGVIIRAGGERLAASAPLQKFLLRAGEATQVLPKLATHLTGKTLSLDVERTAAG